jgi:hypothetical protein
MLPIVEFPHHLLQESGVRGTFGGVDTGTLSIMRKHAFSELKLAVFESGVLKVS